MWCAGPATVFHCEELPLRPELAASQSGRHKRMLSQGRRAPRDPHAPDPGNLHFQPRNPTSGRAAPTCWRLGASGPIAQARSCQAAPATNQATAHLPARPPGRQLGKSASPPASQPACQPTSQPASRPASQPTSQPLQREQSLLPGWRIGGGIGRRVGRSIGTVWRALGVRDVARERPEQPMRHHSQRFATPARSHNARLTWRAWSDACLPSVWSTNEPRIRSIILCATLTLRVRLALAPRSASHGGCRSGLAKMSAGALTRAPTHGVCGR